MKTSEFREVFKCRKPIKKTEFEKRIAKTLKKAGWKHNSLKLHDGVARFVVSVPALNHELKSIVVHFDVKSASVCEYSTSALDDALRISGDERPRAEEIVKKVNEEYKPLRYELYTTGYVGIEGRIAWHECYGEWQAAFWTELENALAGLDRVAWLIRSYKEELVHRSGDEDADDPNQFVTERELCSWVENDGFIAELPGGDVIILHDIEDCDERFVDRKLTIDREDFRLHWEAWCPNWRLEGADLDRAIRYANEWNERRMMSCSMLRVDTTNARFVWSRTFDFYWVRSEALMRDFGERLLEVDFADKEDVEMVEKEFESRCVDVSGLPLFSQEGAGARKDEDEEDIPF